MLRQDKHGVETKARPMQFELHCKSRSRGLDTVFRHAPDLLGRRSLRYLNELVVLTNRSHHAACDGNPLLYLFDVCFEILPRL